MNEKLSKHNKVNNYIGLIFLLFLILILFIFYYFRVKPMVKTYKMIGGNIYCVSKDEKRNAKIETFTSVKANKTFLEISFQNSGKKIFMISDMNTEPKVYLWGSKIQSDLNLKKNQGVLLRKNSSKKANDIFEKFSNKYSNTTGFYVNLNSSDNNTKCKSWNMNEEKFQPPKNIEFIDNSLLNK